jgi:hypothetical protein
MSVGQQEKSFIIDLPPPERFLTSAEIIKQFTLVCRQYLTNIANAEPNIFFDRSFVDRVPELLQGIITRATLLSNRLSATDEFNEEWFNTALKADIETLLAKFQDARNVERQMHAFKINLRILNPEPSTKLPYADVEISFSEFQNSSSIIITINFTEVRVSPENNTVAEAHPKFVVTIPLSNETTTTKPPTIEVDRTTFLPVENDFILLTKYLRFFGIESVVRIPAQDNKMNWEVLAQNSRCNITDEQLAKLHTTFIKLLETSLQEVINGIGKPANWQNISIYVQEYNVRNLIATHLSNSFEPGNEHIIKQLITILSESFLNLEHKFDLQRCMAYLTSQADADNPHGKLDAKKLAVMVCLLLAAIFPVLQLVQEYQTNEADAADLAPYIATLFFIAVGMYFNRNLFSTTESAESSQETSQEDTIEPLSD